MSKKLMMSAAALSIFALAAPVQAADSADGVKVGTLTCHVASGWGFVFGSTKDLRCNLSPATGPGEHSCGTRYKCGGDVGYTSSAVIIWEVFAPNSGIKRGALQGGYGGATASAT